MSFRKTIRWAVGDAERVRRPKQNSVQLTANVPTQHRVCGDTGQRGEHRRGLLTGDVDERVDGLFQRWVFVRLLVLEGRGRARLQHCDDPPTDSGAAAIPEEMEVASARALADLFSPDELRDTYIVPSPCNERVAGVVAEAVREQARRERVTAPTGASRT